MRAMILAAGYGQRLRPLTLERPKPLFPFLNRPILSWALDLLAPLNVREVVVNLHHLPEQIEGFLADQREFDFRIQREPEILGTGGGIREAGSFLADGGTFVVMNGDIICPDLDLAEVVALHRRRGALATMVLRPDPEVMRFGAIEADGEGRVGRFLGQEAPVHGALRPYMFTGIHVMEPEVLGLIPDGPCCINRTAYPAMVVAGQALGAHIYEGYWADLGTPERYLQAHFDLLGGASLIHPTAEVAKEAWVGPMTVIGEGARLGPGARVQWAVVWPGASVEGEASRAVVTRNNRVNIGLAPIPS